MIETLLIAFTTFFVTLAPLKTAPIFAVMTQEMSRAEQRRVALRAVLIATVILMGFSIFGEWLLGVLGIGLPSLRISGGILLFFMAVEIMQGHGTDHDHASHREGNPDAEDIAVFPLATPFIAGPGAITAAILFSVQHDGWMQVAIMGILLLVLLIQLLMFLGAAQLQRILGKAGLQVAVRIMGLLLAALATEFVLEGLTSSGLFPQNSRL